MIVARFLHFNEQIRFGSRVSHGTPAGADRRQDQVRDLAQATGSHEPEAKTVIVFFLPFDKKPATSNIKGKRASAS